MIFAKTSKARTYEQLWLTTSHTSFVWQVQGSPKERIFVVVIQASTSLLAESKPRACDATHQEILAVISICKHSCGVVKYFMSFLKSREMVLFQA